MNAHTEEQIILAACLFEGRESIDIVADVLGATDFGDPRHGRIWRLLASSQGDSPLAHVAVALGVGSEDEQYLDALVATGLPRTPEVLVHYARRIQTASRLRALSALCRRTAEAIERPHVDADPSAEADALIDAALAIGEARTAKGSRRLQDVAKEFMATVRERCDTRMSGRAVGVQGFTSGLFELDGMIDAFQQGHMYLVGGSSGHGKTAFMGHLAMKAAEQRCGVLYATLEMPDVDMVARFASTTTSIDSRRIAGGHLVDSEASRVIDGVKRWASHSMHMLDAPSVTVPAIEREVRRTVRKAGAPDVGVLFVDYLQLVRAAERHGNREQDVAEVADGLLELAKRHNIAVVVGAQLNRSGAARADKRPQTSDLRESSRAEHNATAVLMLYRPGLHGEGTSETMCEILVRKNRKGPVGVARCHFGAASNTWTDIERRYP